MSVIYFLQRISHFICWFLSNVLFLFLFRKTVKGRENLKGLTGPILISANHSSYFDPFILYSVIPPWNKFAPFHYAAARMYWNRFLPFLFLGGSFPVDRGIGLEKSLKSALVLLKNKQTIVIFPEGRRVKEGEKRGGRRGVSYLSLKTNTPIVPVRIIGLPNGFQKQDFLKRRKLEVIIGKPFNLPPQNAEALFDESEKLIELSNFVVDTIYSLN